MKIDALEDHRSAAIRGYGHVMTYGSKLEARFALFVLSRYGLTQWELLTPENVGAQCLRCGGPPGSHECLRPQSADVDASFAFTPVPSPVTLAVFE